MQIPRLQCPPLCDVYDISELLLERADPVVFAVFFAGINSLQTDSSNLSKNSETRDLLEITMNVRNYYLIISKRALSCIFSGKSFGPEPIL